MNLTVWLDPNVAQAGIWAVVILVATGACVYLRRELFPKRPDVASTDLRTYP